MAGGDVAVAAGWVGVTVDVAAVPVMPPLSRRLRRETKVMHRLVESTRLARAFFRGTLTTQAYAEGLARLYPVYVTMEGALERALRDSRLQAFHLPAAYRSRAMLADLRFFGVSPEPIRDGASARYVERVRCVVDETPSLLVAHAYVRFMADVSGGIIAGKVARRVLGLRSQEGLAFFAFPDIPDPAAFREGFRRRLDGFPRDEEESRAIVAEANVAFELNRALADELWTEVFDR
ncbi:MAG: biliverdin-producing heme oxygenase [Labilithrix sp.]|nr:biliverdin-producing heme oxygenase [Labilithrix sp.]MCW5812659.1 biliverdin-producing heme oxygenase [Labilithrix sp.]